MIDKLGIGQREPPSACSEDRSCGARRTCVDARCYDPRKPPASGLPARPTRSAASTTCAKAVCAPRRWFAKPTTTAPQGTPARRDYVGSEPFDRASTTSRVPTETAAKTAYAGPSTAAPSDLIAPWGSAADKDTCGRAHLPERRGLQRRPTLRARKLRGAERRV